ncbi:MAG: ArsR/SmtB family transcription factor [Candidatus Binataceae bacterium]
MKLDATISALADPTRRALLRRLADGPRRASALAAGFAMSRPAICKHTRLLSRAGLIRARQNGRERIYELDPKGGRAIKELIMEFEGMERFWQTALEAFKRYAEEES